jgi:hypothetical protein
MMTEDEDDPLIAMRAGLDQAAASIKELAPVLMSFYCALKEEGFDAREALQLTSTFLTSAFFPKG